ncbi:MAG TPA: PIN domain-containing protein [Solirubrobacterales bacterium]|nr:PIN domain-containing protein [Solirubrobacterales bacterium]
MLIHIDTHIVGWLYEGELRRIPEGIRARLEEDALTVSPVVELELTYLFEIGRVSEPPSAPLSALRRELGLQVADASLAELVQAAAPLSWTRDPFDRLIAAHAIVANAQLVTADETIRENLPLAVWD